MSNEIFIDLHNHPTLKPYGQSVSNGQNNDVHSKSCIWHTDRLNNGDALKENTIGISQYTQSDMSSVQNGGVRVMVVSLYPTEKEFFNIKLNVPNEVTEYLGNWITLFGEKRIKAVRSADFDYWQDLTDEVHFLNLLNDMVPQNGNGKYKIITSAAEIDLNQANTTYLLLSIEGAHVFCEGNDVNDAELWVNLESNVAAMKNPALWPARPFFITLAHHFYNGLCSHAQSLPDKLSKLVSQKNGLETKVEGDKYITNLGYKLIDLLYSTTNGKRILVDVKHMAKDTRKEFYAYHAQHHSTCPIIYSHGGATGQPKFYEKNINVDIDDIETIAASNGIIGLELDQRIMGYDKLKGKMWKWLFGPLVKESKRRKNGAKPVWENLIYIAEVCKNKGFDPWKHICLGTDYDGIINPLNEFRTAESLPNLRTALISHLDDYWNGSSPFIPKNTGGNSTEVIDRIMYKNALQFITDHF